MQASRHFSSCRQAQRPQRFSSRVEGVSEQQTCDVTSNYVQRTTTCHNASTERNTAANSPTHIDGMLSRPTSSKQDAKSSTSSSEIGVSQKSKILGCNRTHTPKRGHHVLICLGFDSTSVAMNVLPKAIHSELCIIQRVSEITCLRRA